MASKGRPFRSMMLEGFEILVGKSASDNDELSLRIAAPEDEWLHVGGGVAGSHVVIRNPERAAVPPGVRLRAAELAAWYSKARGARRVEVHCCRAGNVTKRRGAPAGQVEIRGHSKVYVTPTPWADGEG